MRDGISRQPPEPHAPGIDVILAGLALWLLLGLAAQIAGRLIR